VVGPEQEVEEWVEVLEVAQAEQEAAQVELDLC